MPQILINLEAIKAHEPFYTAWEILLKAKGGDEADYKLMFPVSDTLDINSLSDVIWGLQCLPEHKDLWLQYGLWCVESVMHLTEAKEIHRLFDKCKEADTTQEWGVIRDSTEYIEKEAGTSNIDKRILVAINELRGAFEEGYDYYFILLLLTDCDAISKYESKLEKVDIEALQTAKLREILDAGEWV